MCHVTIISMIPEVFCSVFQGLRIAAVRHFENRKDPKETRLTLLTLPFFANLIFFFFFFTSNLLATSVQLPEEPIGRDDEPVTEEHCRCICSEIGVKWKPVLRNLPCIKENRLENLEGDYKHCKASEQCFQGLLEWTRIAGPQKATTRTLCNALQREGCLDALEALSKEGKYQMTKRSLE